MPEHSEHHSDEAIQEWRTNNNAGFTVLMVATVVVGMLGNALKSQVPKQEPKQQQERIEKKEAKGIAVLIDQHQIHFDFEACNIWIDGTCHAIASIDCRGKRICNEEMRTFLGSTQPIISWNAKGLQMQSNLGSITIPPHVVRLFIAQQRGEHSLPEGVDNILCTVRVCGMEMPMSCTVTCEKQGEQAVIAFADN